MTSPFTEADRAALAARGLSEAEALRQLALFAAPPPPARLVRPATLGDGIETLSEGERDELLALHAEAARAGRITKLVPASGAATRMAQSLSAFVAGETTERQRRDVDVFFANYPKLPFYDELEAEIVRRGIDRAVPALEAEILRALLAADGLALPYRPKGLLPFHSYRGEERTAFAEHLVEAAEVVPDAEGRCRVHFTVSPEHRRGFEAALAAFREGLGAELGKAFDVTFSEQSPATDTLAADPDGRPFRDAAGRLVFRPGGHGALLANLEALRGDVVLLKNVDNIQHRNHAALPVLWEKLLVGALVRAERELFEKQRAAAPARPPELFRPLRVCGVVRNEGEPGGGPFWLRGKDGGESLQIVESAQVDAQDPEQQAILRRATHFNPVDLALSLRSFDGVPYRLGDFVDPDTVFISEKSKDGRTLKALERPGLWNGAMAGWITRFVEIPAKTFAPVKTVLDLLRPEHQP